MPYSLTDKRMKDDVSTIGCNERWLE